MVLKFTWRKTYNDLFICCHAVYWKLSEAQLNYTFPGAMHTTSRLESKCTINIHHRKSVWLAFCGEFKSCIA